MATILEVAKEAGVSVATVSRVLNGSGGVRPKTAEAVNRAVKALKYVPNVSARNLRRNESRVILVLARSFTNTYYAHVLSGINEVMGAAGYQVFMCKNDGEVRQTLQYFKMLENHQADGAILLNCTMEDVWLHTYAGRYPIVQCCEYVAEFDTPKVTIDHEKDGYEATQYLISLGHRRILFMGAENKHGSTLKRYAGYYRAMREAELDTIWEVKADGDYTFERGRECIHDILKLGKEERPTAVFCVSDVLARSVILEASEQGIKVPEELSVVGCDDLDYTTVCHPFLTTIHIPCDELGKQSAGLLLRYMQTLPEKEEDIYLETHLEIRESCAPLE